MTLNNRLFLPRLAVQFRLNWVVRSQQAPSRLCPHLQVISQALILGETPTHLWGRSWWTNWLGCVPCEDDPAGCPGSIHVAVAVSWEQEQKQGLLSSCLGLKLLSQTPHSCGQSRPAWTHGMGQPFYLLLGGQAESIAKSTDTGWMNNRGQFCNQPQWTWFTMESSPFRAQSLHWD